MNGPPRVSVVLPTYDAARHVEEALDSLRSQTFSDFEVVVVDDGSTDGTRERVRRVAAADERVRLVERDESGLPSALNRGIAEARGELVARQDADDRSAPDRLARQVAYLDAHPDVALVGTGAFLLDESGERRQRRRVLERPTRRDLLGGANFVHGSVMARRDALESVGGYDERFDVTEDYDLWLRLAERYPLRNVDEPLYSLRMRDESVYGGQLARVKLYGLYAAGRARGTLPAAVHDAVEAGDVEEVYEHLSPAERRGYHRSMAVELLRYGRPSEAREHARRALAESAVDPLAAAVTCLSYAPAGVVDATGGLYRRAKNGRIAVENWRRSR